MREIPQLEERREEMDVMSEREKPVEIAQPVDCQSFSLDLWFIAVFLHHNLIASHYLVYFLNSSNERRKRKPT